MARSALVGKRLVWNCPAHEGPCKRLLILIIVKITRTYCKYLFWTALVWPNHLHMWAKETPQMINESLSVGICWSCTAGVEGWQNRWYFADEAGVEGPCGVGTPGFCTAPVSQDPTVSQRQGQIFIEAFGWKLIWRPENDATWKCQSFVVVLGPMNVTSPVWLSVTFSWFIPEILPTCQVPAPLNYTLNFQHEVAADEAIYTCHGCDEFGPIE